MRPRKRSHIDYAKGGRCEPVSHLVTSSSRCLDAWTGSSWRTYYLGYANIFCRVWAYLVDSVFITVLAIVIFSILRETAPEVLEWIDYRGQEQPLDSLWVIVAAVYFVGLEVTGATPGKRMVRLRVPRENGEPMTFWASLIRNALRPVDLFFFGFVGIFAYSTSEERQRIGDRAASTIVVQLPPG